MALVKYIEGEFKKFSKFFVTHKLHRVSANG